MVPGVLRTASMTSERVLLVLVVACVGLHLALGCSVQTSRRLLQDGEALSRTLLAL